MSGLPELARRVLAALSTSSQQLSGRRVAALSGTSPTATNRALASLEELGAVSCTSKGQAKLWSATARASTLLGGTVERDVLILTALPLEYAAVRERLETTGERRAPSGARYCEGRVIGQDIAWTVRVFETSMGNATAAAALARAARDFPPDLVVFSGIAGGLRGTEQKHGDVVIVEHVYNGEAGKSSVNDEGESEFKARPMPMSAPAKLIEIARSIRRVHEPLPPTFSIDLTDLVSTESVEADPSNALAKRLKVAFDNVHAIDMETWGLYQGARHLDVPAIAVRGLSDLDGDKSRDDDANWQPVAARNAAAVALELLIRAHHDDMPPRDDTQPAEPDDPTGSAGSRSLPPYAQRWISELGQCSQAAADAAVRDLSNSTTPPKTTVSILATHPPAWVREDRSGIAWAAVASMADGVGSRSARTAWARAAETAAANDDYVAAVLFGVNHARSRRTDDDTEDDTADEIAATRRELQAIDLSRAPQMAPVVDLWLRLSQVEEGRVEDEVLEAAGSAIAALGRAPLLAQLALPQQPSTAASVDGARAVITHALVSVVLVVAVYLLLRQDGRARLWADVGLKLAPWSTEAQLRHLQVELQALHDSLRVGAADSVTEALVDIEAAALAIRDARRAWGGATTEALALAGRARIEMEDPRGALRLLTGAPRGIATAAESQAPQVAHFAAVAALRLGEFDLAAELAERVKPAIEQHFLRAATFSQSKHTRDRALDEYRAALPLASSSYELDRALAGLARLGVNVTADEATAPHLARLSETDPEAADLVRASQALVSGDGVTSLLLSRKYRSLAAVEIQADTLSTLGRAEEAVDVLNDYGKRTGDLAVRMQAMELAGRASLWPQAKALAEAIIGAAGVSPVRDAARRARADIAARAGDWHEVESQLRQVVRERAESSVGDEDPSKSPYAWQLAEAMFHQRKFPAALEMLCEELRKSATDPQKVRLALTLLHQLRGEHPELIDDTAIDWVLTVASSMLSHEDIGASAVTLLIQLPRELTGSKFLKAGTLFDEYFHTYGDSGAVRKVNLESDSDDPDELNLQPLVDEIRTSLQPSAQARSQVGEMVLAGRIPLGFLALVAQRSYAEMLIAQMLNQYVARPRVAAREPWLIDSWVDAAKAAVEGGTVVVDTSALVLSDRMIDRRTLIASFDKVLIPRSLQNDIYRARTRLALRGAGTMGWNEAAGRPVLVEYDQADVDAWAQAAVALDGILPLLSPVDDAHTREGDPAAVTSDPSSGNADFAITAEATARQLGTALWADDVALLRLAEADGVPAFGTPELIAALRDTTALKLPSDLEMLDKLKAHRVVDLPIVDNWLMTARADRWAPGSYTRLAITRPHAWEDVPASFQQYQEVIRGMWADPDLDAEHRVQIPVMWCEAACVGLGRAVAVPARPPVISALIAWTALNTDPLLDTGLITVATHLGPDTLASAPVDGEPVLEHLLAMGRRIQREMFPEGDAVRSVITALSDTIRSASDGATAAAVLARAISVLPDDLRGEAFAALWRAPKTAR